MGNIINNPSAQVVNAVAEGVSMRGLRKRPLFHQWPSYRDCGAYYCRGHHVYNPGWSGEAW
jgi:hypothetical protein